MTEERKSSGAQTHSTPAASARFASASRSATEVPIAATEIRSRALMPPAQAGTGSAASARTASATRSRCHLASPNIAAFACRA